MGTAIMCVFALLWYVPLGRKMEAISQAKTERALAIAKGTADARHLPLLEDRLFTLEVRLGDYEASIPEQRAHGLFLHRIADLMKEHNLKPEDIAGITSYVGDYTKYLCEPLEGRRKPKTGPDAKFSIPFTVAVAAAKGEVKLKYYTPEGLNDKDILAMAQKVNPKIDADFNIARKLRKPTLNNTQIIIHLKRPVLGRGITQPIHRSGISIGKNVRNAPFVPKQFYTFGFRLVIRSLRTAARNPKSHYCKCNKSIYMFEYHFLILIMFRMSNKAAT